MKKFKKVLALSLALAMGLSLVACGGSDDATTTAGGDDSDTTTEGGSASDDASVLHIYCWNTEVPTRIAAAVPGFTPDSAENPENGGTMEDGTRVEFVITANQDNAYQNALDADLQAGKDIDIFAIEADYALKYVDTDYAMSVLDAGLTEDDMANMYDYTKQIVTDSNGVQKGVSWQATPGVFMYRRSIATAVLGSDDPATVQEAVKDWDTFADTAKKMKDAGYQMLSGYDDSYRAFSNNVSQPWVVDGEVVIDDQLKAWVDQTKDFTDNGYNNKTSLWADDWGSDMSGDATVFGYFGCPWFVNFSVAEHTKGDSSDSFGDWAVTEGPAGFYWGGTWVVPCTNGSGNEDAVRDILYYLTCDTDSAKKITDEYDDFTNNEPAMKEYAESEDYGTDIAGGQNTMAVYYKGAPSIDLSNLSAYDQGCNEEFQAAMHNYFEGNATYEEALDQFYSAIQKKYPELKVPAAE